MARSFLRKELDSRDHVCAAWAAKLRKMQPLQCKLAGRLIAEVIFKGKMGMLTLDSTIQRQVAIECGTHANERLGIPEGKKVIPRLLRYQKPQSNHVILKSNKNRLNWVPLK